jgi:uncharacterized membrane protein
MKMGYFMKKLMLIIFVVLICGLFGACADNTSSADAQYKARVVSVDDESYADEASGKYYEIQYLTVEFTEGPYAGQTHETDVFIDATNYTDIALYRTGDTIEASVSTAEDGSLNVSVVTLVRAPYVVILVVIFLLLIGIIGRKKGIKTILALVFTVAAVVFVLVPLIASGYNPIISAALVCIVVSVVTLFAVGGFNKKALASVLGTVSGLVCAAVITLIFSALMRITGIDTSAVELLMIADTDVTFHYQGILTAGILIGCIGAVMDVAMSISSSMNEMASIDVSLTHHQLFSSGMAVGRDIIGTMANTLILAYTGGALMLMVVWSVYGISFADMLNKGYIVLEVAKSLCGSIGMVMTIPLTALIASRLVAHTPPQEDDEDADPERTDVVS